MQPTSRTLPLTLGSSSLIVTFTLASLAATAACGSDSDTRPSTSSGSDGGTAGPSKIDNGNGSTGGDGGTDPGKALPDGGIDGESCNALDGTQENDNCFWIAEKATWAESAAACAPGRRYGGADQGDPDLPADFLSNIPLDERVWFGENSAEVCQFAKRASGTSTTVSKDFVTTDGAPSTCTEMYRALCIASITR